MRTRTFEWTKQQQRSKQGQLAKSFKLLLLAAAMLLSLILPAPSANYVSAANLTDTFADWSKVYVRSDADANPGNSTEDWTQDAAVTGSAPADAYNLVKSPSATDATEPYLIYRYDHISALTAKVYYHRTYYGNALSSIRIHTSADAVTWQEEMLAEQDTMDFGGGWNRANVTLKSTPPAGTKYLKMTLTGPINPRWSYRIGSVQLTYAAASAAPAELFVSTLGNDTTATGTIASPFRTLEGARNKIRQLKSSSGLPAGGVIVYVRQGDYTLSQTFSLGSQDSGESGKPVVYSSYPGEKVRLLGGAKLSGSSFTAVSDQAAITRIPSAARPYVKVVSLSAQGVTNYGSLQQYGFGFPTAAADPQLIVDHEPRTLARWPNTGFVLTGQIYDAGGSLEFGQNVDRGPTFGYADARPSGWSQITDVWMNGYWAYDYAIHNLRISSIDTGAKKITAAQKTWAPITAGQRYYYYNILEELDTPGEWYLDRSSGMLYYYPLTSLAQSEVLFTQLTDDMISLNSTSHVIWRGMTLEGTRGKGMTVTGGSHIQVTGNLFRSTGLYAVTLAGGTSHSVTNNEMTELGQGGVDVSGGDRSTLTAAGHLVSDNHIHKFSQITRTYTPAVQLGGVGNKVTHNLIHDSPHQAIQFSGNDNIIEYNEIYDVVKETNDSSAIYAYNDFSMWGNKIQYNYFHDIVGEGQGPGIKATAVYLDNYISGTMVVGNIFERCSLAVFIHGGRSNLIADNKIFDSTASINVIKTGYAPPLDSLSGVPYTSSAWTSKYPEIATVLTDRTEDPMYNQLLRNVIVSTPGIGVPAEDYGILNQNNTTYTDYTAFMNPAAEDFRLIHSSTALAAGTNEFDLQLIGPNRQSPSGLAAAIHHLTIKTASSHSGKEMVLIDKTKTEQLIVHAETGDGFGYSLPAASLTYQSDNTAAATVSAAGLITAVNNGTAKITVTNSATGHSQSIRVNVGNGVSGLTAMTLTAPSQTMRSGSSAVLSMKWQAGGGYVDLYPITTFSSSNSAVASVDASGRVIAKSPGQATLTATTARNGSSKTASTTITVQQPAQSITLSNAGFEADGAYSQSITGWYTWTPDGTNDADYAEYAADAHGGTHQIAHWKASAYTILTAQTVSVSNGTYTLKAWVRSSGGQNTAILFAKSFGGSERNTAIPATGAWTQVTVPNIPVTNGQIEFGFYSEADANEWLNMDDVELIKL
ncbi:right-handed parallel beta-helix repeat-containing protein [Paenibacillus sp. GCM10023252]|uniref:right-handed parallel beta-helix repeat-containing protein n=1 Tax=Paenibacillus sp. GCM10023252 TaxID=3252649 RepID=UPI00361CE925